MLIPYNREKAVAYARVWAFRRNPAYYAFDGVGGDCTNFASQCLYAGVGVMNYTHDLGWYYRTANERSAGWTGVEYFYRFLMDNERAKIGNGNGPFAVETDLDGLEMGDFIQLGNGVGDYYHTLVVVGFSGRVPLASTHSQDSYAKPLYAWHYARLRCLHILGARK